MFLSTRHGRQTGSTHQSLREYAYRLAAGALPAPRAEVMVFRGDPMFNRRREIFYALSQLHSDALLDELQYAERITRNFIDLIDE